MRDGEETASLAFGKRLESITAPIIFAEVHTAEKQVSVIRKNRLLKR